MGLYLINVELYWNCNSIAKILFIFFIQIFKLLGDRPELVIAPAIFRTNDYVDVCGNVVNYHYFWVCKVFLFSENCIRIAWCDNGYNNHQKLPAP